MLDHVYRQIGRRGAFQLALAIVQGIIGWSILVAPPVTIHALILFQHVPIWAIAAYWLVPSAFGLISAFSRPGLDLFSFALSYFTLFVWGFVYIISWFPNHELDVGTAFRSAGIYWGFASMILVVSRWSENLLPLASRPRWKASP